MNLAKNLRILHCVSIFAVSAQIDTSRCAFCYGRISRVRGEDAWRISSMPLDRAKPNLLVAKLGGLVLVVLGFLLAASGYRAASAGYTAAGIIVVAIGIALLVWKAARRNQGSQL
jgi:hypothetical protein